MQLKIRELYGNLPQKDRPTSISKEDKIEQYANMLRESLHTLITVTKEKHRIFKSIQSTTTTKW